MPQFVIDKIEQTHQPECYENISTKVFLNKIAPNGILNKELMHHAIAVYQKIQNIQCPNMQAWIKDLDNLNPQDVVSYFYEKNISKEEQQIKDGLFKCIIIIYNFNQKIHQAISQENIKTSYPPNTLESQPEQKNIENIFQQLKQCLSKNMGEYTIQGRCKKLESYVIKSLTNISSQEKRNVWTDILGYKIIVESKEDVEAVLRKLITNITNEYSANITIKTNNDTLTIPLDIQENKVIKINNNNKNNKNTSIEFKNTKLLFVIHNIGVEIQILTKEMEQATHNWTDIKSTKMYNLKKRISALLLYGPVNISNVINIIIENDFINLPSNKQEEHNIPWKSICISPKEMKHGNHEELFSTIKSYLCKNNIKYNDDDFNVIVNEVGTTMPISQTDKKIRACQILYTLLICGHLTPDDLINKLDKA